MADNLYKIKKGDTLWDLAKKYKTTVNELASLNGIKNPRLIRAGATLKLPYAAKAAEPGSGGSASSGGTVSETPPQWKTTVDDIYENSRTSQMAALQGQYDNQKLDYESQKSKAPEKFNPLRNEAYVNTEMAERSRKESMANMGLSGAGGTSQTHQQRNINTLLSTLGGISRQQQDFTDNVNFALGQLGTQFDANKRSINAQIDSEKSRAYLDQGNWEKNYGLQKGQLDLSISDSTFNKAFELLKSSRITKKEFENMTGIDIR